MSLRAGFFGSPEFAVPSLLATARACDLRVVVTQPDRPAGRGRKLVAPPVKRDAQRLGLPVLAPTRLRDGSVVAALREYALDVIVVTAYGRILPVDLLDLPRLGCINVHASLLPRWRGAAPIQRAILAGDPETGVAIMKMDAGLDTGPVHRSQSLRVGPHETSGELSRRLAVLGGELLEQFLSEFPDVPAPTAQDETLATYAVKLEKGEGEVDWTRPVARLVDHVRGMDPWPAATTRLGDRVFKLYAPRPSSRVGDGATPGTVLGVDDEGVHVVCGDGVLCIEDIQAPGKRRMPARAWAAGNPILPRARLGTDV